MTRTLKACLLAFALTSTNLSAQPVPLDDNLITATQISRQGSDTIEQYVTQWLEVLQSTDTAEVESARQALLDPLQKSPSPSFRIQYGSNLKADLTRLMAGTEDQAVFVTTLAGALSTVDAHALILGALADPRPSVRYAAARGTRQQLKSIDAGPAALNAQHADALINRIATRVEAEKNHTVLDGLLTVASDAVERSSTSAPIILERLCTALTTNLRAGLLDSDPLAGARAALRLVGAAQQQFRNSRGNLPDDLSAAAAILAGDVMGAVFSAVENNPSASSPETTDALAQLVNSSHNLVFFAHMALVNPQIDANNDIPEAFASWKQNGNSRNLRQAIDKWIGPTGLLTKAPYSVDPSAFAG